MSDTIVTTQPEIHTLTTNNQQVAIVDNPQVQVITVGIAGPAGIIGLQSMVCSIYQPHLHQAVLDKPFIFYIDSDQFSGGITIKEVRLATSAISTYSLAVLDMASPTDASPTTIATIATAASTEATLTLDIDVIAGRYIGLDLPITAADFINIQIWFERKAAS